MLKSISIITGFMVVMTMPIAAVEIENHDVKPGFIKQIAGCYKRVPAALLARVDNPRIIAAKDLAAVVSSLGLPANYFSTQWYPLGNHLIKGMAFGGDDYMKRPRAAVFIENTLSAEHSVAVCFVVMHEFGHLYDDPPSRSPEVPRQSYNENFVTAWKQDLGNIIAKRSTSNEMREHVDKFNHYRSSAREAFAEAVAIIIFLHPKIKRHQNYAALFPNVMSYVRKLLIDDGIIQPNHKGDAQILRELERTRR